MILFYLSKLNTRMPSINMQEAALVQYKPGRANCLLPMAQSIKGHYLYKYLHQSQFRRSVQGKAQGNSATYHVRTA